MIIQGDKVIKKDLYLDTLKSKTILATDSSGKVIEGVMTKTITAIISGFKPTATTQSVITAGSKKTIRIPFAWTDILRVNLNEVSEPRITCSAVIDIWKSSSETPTVSDTITASAKPTLSSATAHTDTTLTGWTKTGSANDYLTINVDSATDCRNLTLEIVLRV